MAKRQHSTTIWEEDWFIGMTKEQKLFWFFIKDKCDHAGIWKPNLKQFENIIDGKLSLEKTLNLLNLDKKRIRLLEGGRWFLEDFITFQYGSKLNPKNRMFNSVINELKMNGIDIDSIRGQIEVNFPSTTPQGIRGKDKVISSKDVITTSVITPYYIKSDLQRLVCAYKIAKGFKFDDRTWDNAYFARFSKPAKLMLEYFHNSFQKCLDCLDSLSKEFNRQGLTWTLDTIQKHAADWALKIENNIKAKVEE